MNRNEPQPYAIIRNQSQSGVLVRNQTQSDAIGRNQAYSFASLAPLAPAFLLGLLSRRIRAYTYVTCHLTYTAAAADAAADASSSSSSSSSSTSSSSTAIAASTRSARHGARRVGHDAARHGARRPLSCEVPVGKGGSKRRGEHYHAVDVVVSTTTRWASW